MVEVQDTVGSCMFSDNWRSCNWRSWTGHVVEVVRRKLGKRKSNPKRNKQQIKMLASRKIVAKSQNSSESKFLSI